MTDVKQLVQRAIASGLMSYPKPSPHKGRTPRKLTPMQIKELLAMRKAGDTLNQIAGHFHVSRTTAHYYLNGRGQNQKAGAEV